MAMKPVVSSGEKPSSESIEASLRIVVSTNPSGGQSGVGSGIPKVDSLLAVEVADIAGATEDIGLGSR